MTGRDNSHYTIADQLLSAAQSRLSSSSAFNKPIDNDMDNESTSDSVSNLAALPQILL